MFFTSNNVLLRTALIGKINFERQSNQFFVRLDYIVIKILYTVSALKITTAFLMYSLYCSLHQLQFPTKLFNPQIKRIATGMAAVITKVLVTTIVCA